MALDNVDNVNWFAGQNCQDSTTNATFTVNTFGGSKSFTSAYVCSGTCALTKTNNATVSQVSVVHGGVVASQVSVTGLLATDNLVAGNVSLTNVPLLVVSNITNGKQVSHLGALSFAIGANSVPALAKAQNKTSAGLWSPFYLPCTIHLPQLIPRIFTQQAEEVSFLWEVLFLFLLHTGIISQSLLDPQTTLLLWDQSLLEIQIWERHQ